MGRYHCGNRLPTNGMHIDFTAPTIVDGEIEVVIDEVDVESEMLFWESALIMYVLGKDLSMNAVICFTMMPGYFILKFHSHEYKDLVQMRGPYTIHAVPMILRDWSADFDFKRDMLRTLPIWVKLPNLPLHLWGAKSLGKIGSALGTPLCTDECTANKLRVSYARILVEVDIAQKQKNYLN